MFTFLDRKSAKSVTFNRQEWTFLRVVLIESGLPEGQLGFWAKGEGFGLRTRSACIALANNITRYMAKAPLKDEVKKTAEKLVKFLRSSNGFEVQSGAFSKAEPPKAKTYERPTRHSKVEFGYY